MKRSRVGLQEIADQRNLSAAFWRAARGRRGQQDVEAFRSKLDRQLSSLAKEILAEVWCPRPMRRFSIRDPKPRIIHAPAFRDRVLHHALMAHMEPWIDRTLIDDCYACRIGKGAHAAVRRAAANSRNARWYTKADISGYFAHIDHSVLLRQIHGKFSDHGLLRLVTRIIEAHADGPGRGLAIGALTSQVFANFYLSEIDRTISCAPGTLGYLRYMDDMVWWTDSKADAEKALALTVPVLHGLRLKLKPETIIRPTSDGIALCGHAVLPDRIYPGKRRRTRFVTGIADAESRYLGCGHDPSILQRNVDPMVGLIRHTSGLAWRRTALSRAPLAQRNVDV